MNYNAWPFDIKFVVDPMSMTGFHTYENDPNIIDSTATEIIEEEEIKEQHDRDITYLPDHRRTI